MPEIVQSTLPLGKHSMIILSRNSPMDIHLVTQSQFDEYTENVVPVIMEHASGADLVINAKSGDLVLAMFEDFWYRATIIKVNLYYRVSQKKVTLRIFSWYFYVFKYWFPFQSTLWTYVNYLLTYLEP